MVTKSKKLLLSKHHYQAFHAKAWDIRESLLYMIGSVKSRVFKVPLTSAIKAVYEVLNVIDTAWKRDFPKSLPPELNQIPASNQENEGSPVEWIQRVKEFDAPEEGLFAFRLNKPCLKRFDCKFRQGDILMVKPFEEGRKEGLRRGSFYISVVNGKHLFLERFNEENPAEWKEPEPGFHYSRVFAGYFHTTPADKVEMIGEVVWTRAEYEDRKWPVVMVHSGFVKGSSGKRLNYLFEDHHTNKQYNRFIDVCQGRAKFEKAKDAIRDYVEPAKEKN